MILIDGFEVDASLQEEHSFDSDVTEHPVEDGSDVADHVRAQPIAVTIEGVVTDTPIGAIASRRAVGAFPSNDAFAKLLEIRDRRQPVRIETSLRAFDSMVLTSLSVPRDAATGDALRFRASFRQVVLVSNERTTLRVSVPRAARKVNRGTKQAPLAVGTVLPNGGKVVSVFDPGGIGPTAQGRKPINAGGGNPPPSVKTQDTTRQLVNAMPRRTPIAAGGS